MRSERSYECTKFHVHDIVTELSIGNADMVCMQYAIRTVGSFSITLTYSSQFVLSGPLAKEVLRMRPYFIFHAQHALLFLFSLTLIVEAYTNDLFGCSKIFASRQVGSEPSHVQSG